MKVLNVLGRALLKTPFPSLKERKRRRSKKEVVEQPQGTGGEEGSGTSSTEQQFTSSSCCSFEPADENLQETDRNVVPFKQKDDNDKEKSSDDFGSDGGGDDDDDDDQHGDNDDASDSSSSSSSSSLSSCSVGDDQAALQRRREEFHHLQFHADGGEAACSSIDKDVQVFLSISKQLPNQSLIFLLQNHARQNMLNLVIPEAALNAVLASDLADETSRGSHSSGLSAIKKTKHFRFAELSNQQVRTIVHIIERNDEILDEDDKGEEKPGGEDCNGVSVIHHHEEVVDPIQRYWWTPHEHASIRTSAIDLVRFYRKYEREFINAIEILTQENKSQVEVEIEMKELAALHGSTRGMESHICKCLSSPRKSTVRAVLEVQEEMKREEQERRKRWQEQVQVPMQPQPQHQQGKNHVNENTTERSDKGKNDCDNVDSHGNNNMDNNLNDHDPSIWMERIRNASLAASLPNRTFAKRYVV
jgi:hypothetical protein